MLAALLAQTGAAPAVDTTQDASWYPTDWGAGYPEIVRRRQMRDEDDLILLVKP